VLGFGKAIVAQRCP